MEPIEIPEPVGKAAAIKTLGLAIWAFVCIIVDVSGAVAGSGIGVIAAGAYAYDVFVLRKNTVPLENLGERMAQLTPGPPPAA